MSIGLISSVIRKNFGMIMLTAFLVSAVSFAGLVYFSKSFKVGTDYLIIQQQTSFQDFYSLAKSSEYLGKVLGESIYSDRFIDEVMQTGKVGQGMLPLDKKDRLDDWKKMVVVNKTNLEVGLISVDVFDNDQRNALRVSQAVGQVLTEKNMLFRGGDEKSTEVRIFSGPITERNPNMKEILSVAILGFILGGLLGTLWISAKMELPSKVSYEDFQGE